MYFNDERNSTNIDTEFEQSKKLNFNFPNKKILWYILLSVIVIIVIFCIIFLVFKSIKKEYYLTLNGLEDMVVYQNSIFVDPGYYAYDNKDNDYSDEVVVSGQVNTDVVGEYVITYSYNEIVKKRTVTVIRETNQVTYMYLLGDKIIYLKIGDKYTEPGYTVLDSVSYDLEERVVITGRVNTDVAGTYKLVYSVINDAGITINAERTIIVMDSDINLSYSPTGYTNGEVSITVSVVSNYFDYILLPDGKKNNNRQVTYKVNKNSDYEFTIYNKDGSSKTSKISITNIDNVLPSGSCSAVYNGNSTVINVTASDNLGIDGYNYIINNSEKKYISKNTYTYLGNGKNVSVDIKDKTGNTKNIKCTYKDDSLTVLYNMTVAQQPSTSFPCNLNVVDHNRKLSDKVKRYGLKTRAGVVAAATYLTRDLGYRVEYWWAGKYDKVGINSEWGCPRKEWDKSNTVGKYAYGTVHPFGLDCTGFIKWAFVNAGFDASLIPRGDMTYYYGSILPKVVSFASAGNKINDIKPGDLLCKPGHCALIVAVSDTQLKIAQSVHAGVKEDLINKVTGKAITNTGDFATIILLDEFYNKYGN